MKGPGFVCDHCGHQTVLAGTWDGFRGEPSGIVPLGWYEVRYLVTIGVEQGGKEARSAETAYLCTGDCLIAWTQARDPAP